MMGYPAQLQQIFHAIADPLTDRSIKQLGYALGDVLAAAYAYQSVLVERLDATLAEFHAASRLQTVPDDPEERLHLALAYGAGIATFAAAPVEDDLPGLLTDRTGIPSRAAVDPQSSARMSVLGCTVRVHGRVRP